MDIGIAEDGMANLDAVSAAVRTVTADPVVGSAEEVAEIDLDCIVASGNQAVRAVVTLGGGPILVVKEPFSLAPVSNDDVASAIEEIAAEAYEIVEHRPLTIDGDAGTALALEQVMVMTVEPATITEYRLTREGEEVCQYRADGLVFASPSGSGGYQRSVGGPILDPTLGGIAITPIAPYRTDPDHWVLSDRLTCRVMRDAGEVGLFVDGEETDTVDAEEEITVELGDSYRVIRTESSRSPFARSG